MNENQILWSEERLEADRSKSVEQFRNSRLSEDLEEYRSLCEEYHALTTEVLRRTDNLLEMDLRTALGILTDEDLLYVFRYLTGPPISQDDLKTLSESSLAPTKLENNPDSVREIVDTVYSALDTMRFGWVEEEREPSESEVAEAVLATAEMIAMRRMATQRRMGASKRQEGNVEAALSGTGMKKVKARDIYSMDSAPPPGTFCQESVVLGRKADFVGRLWDGRLLTIECKVSNSHVNSVKRLNREAVPKGLHWKEELEEDVIPASVLDGVFKLKNLKDAQNQGISLFWEHSLDELANWVEKSKPEGESPRGPASSQQ